MISATIGIHNVIKDDVKSPRRFRMAFLRGWPLSQT